MGSCLSKKVENPTAVVVLRKVEDVDVMKKEIFVIKHRRSHSHDKQIPFGTPSSCTREEVDAILVQCGRLSRSSSANTPANNYSGSKRSFDFDNQWAATTKMGEEDDDIETQRRQSRSSSSPSKSCRSRDRSGSRERSAAGSGRRVSRSPGRRPLAAGGADSSSIGGVRPGKLVSVPASITSSLGAGNEQASVRRIAVRRDVRSPRSQSPAHSHQPQKPPPLTLGLSKSRKTDHSPHRRNPLSEIDNNHSSHLSLRKAGGNQNLEEAGIRSLSSKRVAQGEESNPAQPMKTSQVSDSLQPKLNRSRSWSRSRDFDQLGRGLNPNSDHSPSSYASILLEDIHNFHQKSGNSNMASALPQSVTKAYSILEAVADLNSTTSSSTEDKRRGEWNKFETRDPFAETALGVSNDLMEPSLHKYVTIRQGTQSDWESDTRDQESSGSNSVVGGGQGQHIHRALTKSPIQSSQLVA